jgi:hypothetical protein
MKSIVKGIFLTSGMWVLTVSIVLMQVVQGQTQTAILGPNNQTIQIPTFDIDPVFDSVMSNGTRTIPYSGEPVIEIPWRNASHPVTIDVNEYVTCVEASQQGYIEVSHKLATNLSIEGNRPIDLLDSDMDSCIFINSESMK